MKNTTPSTDENTINKLKKLNEDLENFFQSTIIPQLFFDRNLILRKYSPAAVKQFNFNDESIGKHLKDLSNNLRYQTLEEDIKKIISTNEIVEKEIQTTDEKWYRMNVLPYMERQEKVTNGVIVTFIDINNYVLNLKELQKLNSEHEMFIFSVSHDLKSPLSNIEGLVNSLKDSIESGNAEKRDHIVSMIDSSVSKMKDLISELTGISHIKAQIPDNKSTVSFSDIFAEVYLTLKDQIDESHAKVKCSFEVSDINMLRKDLRSILYNLLSNSLKYRSPDRKLLISVSTRREGDYVLLSVKDNGRGIEEDKKGVIFSQFTRVLDNVEGTGIGLYLVSAIVDAQGGKIVVNSKVNEGAEFLIYLKA